MGAWLENGYTYQMFLLLRQVKSLTFPVCKDTGSTPSSNAGLPAADLLDYLLLLSENVTVYRKPVTSIENLSVFFPTNLEIIDGSSDSAAYPTN